MRSLKEFAHPGGEDKQPTDLNRAIWTTVTVARNEWKYVAEVKLDLDPELPPVPCVVSDFNRALLNLMVNAAQAIGEVVTEGVDEKGLITISTRRVGNEVEIRVTHNGPGIPEAVPDKIFDPFFTSKEPGKGTGQGLAIAYRAIVERHGGSLTCISQEGNQVAPAARALTKESGHGKDPLRGRRAPDPPGPAPNAARKRGQ